MFSTIGYEKASLEDFIATLLHAEVNVLVDIRDVPISRRKGFSKAALKEALETRGIVYVHLKGLGDPKEGREAARAGQYALFQKIYLKHMETNPAKADFERVLNIGMNSHACLMCYEREPEFCHRTLVGERISAIVNSKIRNLGVREGLAADDKKRGTRESSSAREGAAARQR